MRTILICFLFIVQTLSVYGCFSSRERGNKVDSGSNRADNAIETGEQSGSGGIENIRGKGGIDNEDDVGMNEAPCVPNCPELDWVTIPGSTFMMGSAGSTFTMNSDVAIATSFQQPQHEVTMQTFKMSKTEITVAQYGICVDEGICSALFVPFPEFVPFNIDEQNNWGKSGRENHPVNFVDWHQAKEFAEWIGARLPSEAEWEYAARSGGRDIVYPWGNEYATCERAVIGIDERGDDCWNETTMEVCSKPLGNTTQGLCDMAGNVQEWVEDDWHSTYSGAPSDGQAWVDIPRGNVRVLRSGSWLFNSVYCRSAFRDRGPTDFRVGVGFRVVMDPK